MIRQALSGEPSVNALAFDTAGLTGWDSRFVAFVGTCIELGKGRDLEVRCGGLPEGVRRLLRLARLLPGKTDARPAPVKVSFLEKLGERTSAGWEGIVGLFTFLGENLIAFGKLLRGRAQFRWADAFLVMEQTGPQALAIVAMINFLVGLILAFVGATELQRFGANIYVADLVGIASVREMSAIMTGIILSGRTGAAFAAQLGTMKVNEELSALQTFGISPIEFLVLPRMVALMLMMPFLCIFADMISIAGGYVVSVGMLDITSTVYLNRTIHAITLTSFFLGIVKGSFFGFLVAFTGCLRGMQSGVTAAAVGEAATRAVVSGIAAIIASDGVFAVLCNALKI
jgi:phospholipid/cholesterol/gamma-HCH transport system permease protein